jgi:hypothetical protein
MDRLPCTISLIRRRGTPIDTASLFCVIPNRLRTGSQTERGVHSNRPAFEPSDWYLQRAFFTTLDFNCIRPNPGTVASMS